ncbi:DUF4124 domain-containing protein [Microbulbifer hydrolyticus]|uniref:DUF4124 domain-containing protein n=1 Tax=Microbulbifer hydrolyticus TaxID=48074 RepID=A0A6P1T7B6_9GAMM|nr:DUF4124 domain-containing protein [Microbulbifer hydrolyticus]MBB5211569.1 hypothetical protein [Microbulbifer hydrolyticus]QHQ37691.1 DUF4124 domain-containing protein [Microbulbifer hydrolyticus]
MIRWIALLAVLLAAPVLAQQDSAADDKKASGTSGGSVYKIVGPDGRVTFSDSPPAGQKAEKVEIGPINVQPIAPKQPLRTRKLSPGDRRDRDDYEGPVNFAIVSPANDATIPPGQRFVVLQVALDPVPKDGYEFFVVVDGQRWSGTSSGTSLDISALERGTHTIQAVLLGAGGRPLAQSQAIQVHVKRPGGQIPDFPAEQAPQMPKLPQAPGVARPPKPQPR